MHHVSLYSTVQCNTFVFFKDRSKVTVMRFFQKCKKIVYSVVVDMNVHDLFDQII